MTPLAGFVAAVIAGWFIRDPLRAAAAVLVPFLAGGWQVSAVLPAAGHVPGYPPGR